MLHGSLVRCMSTYAPFESRFSEMFPEAVQFPTVIVTVGTAAAEAADAPMSSGDDEAMIAAPANVISLRYFIYDPFRSLFL